MSSGAMVTPEDLAWRALRDAALSAVNRSWPIVPGAHRPDGPGFTALTPMYVNWESAPVTDPERAFALWDQQPAPVLLVCGRGVDALELPWRVTKLLPALAGAGLAVPVTPVAEVLPPPRWMLLVATGSGQLAPELAQAGARLLAGGHWVVLPPSRVGYAKARWSAPPPPEDCDVALPGGDEVQRGLVEALSSGLPR